MPLLGSAGVGSARGYRPPKLDIVTQNLVVNLDAGNRSSYTGSGTTWSDISGSSNNCVFSSTPTFNQAGDKSWFTFDGAANNGTITYNGTLNFSSSQTLMMVMRHTYTSGRRNPWNQAYGGAGTWTHEQGETISQYFGNAGVDGNPYIGIGSAATPRSAWYCIAATRDPSQHIWYFNGVPGTVTPNPYGVLAATTTNITIGHGYAGFWQGDMAIVLAYTRALSAAEVFTNFEAIRTRFAM